MKGTVAKSKLLLLVAIISMLIGVLVGAWFHKETVVVREGTADTPAAMSSVNLMVDYGDGTIKTWNTVSWHEAMSVVNLLEKVADAKEITLTTKDLGEKNISIESINATANDPKTGVHWQYWINNTYQPKIASKYFLKPGDIVFWKYVRNQGK